MLLRMEGFIIAVQNCTPTKSYTTRFYDYGGLFVLAYRISDKRNGGYVRPVLAF
jgi:hypothetical protein